MRAGEVALDETVARALKAARMLAGWSQKELSERAGVSLSVIKRIEGQASFEHNSGVKTNVPKRKRPYLARYETVEALSSAFLYCGVTFRANESEVSVRVADFSIGELGIELKSWKLLQSPRDP